MNESDLTILLDAIHASPTRIVLEFAGAGSQALAWLHSVGGSSRTILEATDRYAVTSLVDLLGYQPGSLVSPEVAIQMARAAFRRASQLAEPGTPVAGVACTATIATDRLKRGAHRAFVAFCTSDTECCYECRLVKGQRDRHAEEALVSRLILHAVAQASDVSSAAPFLQDEESLVVDSNKVSLLDWLWEGELPWVLVDAAGRRYTGNTWPGLALLSGSFNPLHEGHRHLRDVAAEVLGQSVCFELPMINAEKAAIDQAETERRLPQFRDYAPVLLTRAPLFSQKSRMFPDSVFVVGYDTAARILDSRFYNYSLTEMQQALGDLQARGCRFLVAGRLQGNDFLTLDDLEVPPDYEALFQRISPDQFRVDISSTEIRAQQSS